MGNIWWGYEILEIMRLLKERGEKTITTNFSFENILNKKSIKKRLCNMWTAPKWHLNVVIEKSLNSFINPCKWRFLFSAK